MGKDAAMAIFSYQLGRAVGMQKAAATAKALRHFRKLVKTRGKGTMGALKKLLSRTSVAAHGERLAGAAGRGQAHAHAGILDRVGEVLGQNRQLYYGPQLARVLAASRKAVGAPPYFG